MAQTSGEFTPSFGVGKFGSNFCPFAKPDPDRVVSDLIDGTSVAVLGLRRIGKTSLLAETRERLISMGKNVIWVDLDTSDTPTKALSAILGAMQQGKNKGIVAGIKNWVENSEFFPTELKSTVDAMVSGAISNSSENFDERYVEALFNQTGRLLETLDSESKPIIIFDELTTLIKTTIDQSNSEETRMVVGRLNSFLGLLRSWRKDEIGIRMAVSGSVSFDWLQREYGVRSDSINDCVRIYIEEMGREGAKKLLDMCLNAKTIPNWSEQLTEDLLNILPAFYPGVIQLAFNVLKSESAPIENLTQPIKRKIQKALWDQYYRQFEARFQRYGPSEQNRVIKFIDALSSQENYTIETEEALNIVNCANTSENSPNGREIIYHLISDSFIDIELDGYCFTSGLVPAWRNNKLKQETG